MCRTASRPHSRPEIPEDELKKMSNDLVEVLQQAGIA